MMPLEQKFSRHIKPHLEKLFIKHKPPKRLQSDRGKEFEKEVKEVTWNDFFVLLGFWAGIFLRDKTTLYKAKILSGKSFV